MVLMYIILTAFAIIYLGIRWFVDIIGGMILATFAVQLTDKTTKPVWTLFDERTINSRLATVLTRPGHSFSFIFSRVKAYISKLMKPSSTETGTFIVVILILTGAVITWDFTHNELPAEGVQSAQGAVASEGWLATMDNQSGEAIVLIHDVSDPLSEPSTVDQPLMQLDSPYALYENYLAVANETELRLIDVEKPNTVLLYQQHEAIQSLQMTALQGKPVVLFIADDVLHAVDLGGDTVLTPTLPNGETVKLNSSWFQINSQQYCDLVPLEPPDLKTL